MTMRRREREYDPRSNRGLVGSIAAGWREEQRSTPRDLGSKTYSGAPDSLGGSARDVKFSRNLRLQNISEAVKKVADQPVMDEDEPKQRPSYTRKMGKMVKNSVRNIFVPKSVLDEDLDIMSDSQVEFSDEMDRSSSLRESSSMRDASQVKDSSSSRGRIPVLAAKLKDSAKRGRSRSIKREETKREEEDAAREDTMNHSARIRNRSQGIVGRLRRRGDEQRKRRGARNSTSPRRSSMPTSPRGRRASRSPQPNSVTGSTAEPNSDSSLPLQKGNSLSLLQEAQLASRIFNDAKAETKQEDRTLSTHTSRITADFFDPAAEGGGDGSLKSGFRLAIAAAGFNGSSTRSSNGQWSVGPSDESSSRHGRTLGDIRDASTSSLPAISSAFRTRLLPNHNNSQPNILSSVRCDNSHTDDAVNEMDNSTGSLPPLSRFSATAIATSMTPFPTGGAPYFPTASGKALSPFQPQPAEGSGHTREQQAPSKSSHERRKTNKSRRNDNMHASDSQMRYASSSKRFSTTRASRHQSSKDQPKSPVLSSRGLRRTRGKMSASDRTHDGRRSRLTTEESSRHRTVQVERSGTYGALLDKQASYKERRSNHSSRQRRSAMDASDPHHRSKNSSKSATDASDPQHKSKNSSKSAHRRPRERAEEPERSKSADRKSRRQRTKPTEDPPDAPKPRSNAEGKRKKLSRKGKNNKSQLQKKKKESFDNEEESVQWSRVGSNGGGGDTEVMQPAMNPDNAALPKEIKAPTTSHVTELAIKHDEALGTIQKALNPSNLENAALPDQINGLELTKLTQTKSLETPDDILPAPRSHHPRTYHSRTTPLEQEHSDEPLSKSYHAGTTSERRSSSLPPKAKKERSDPSKKKKKKKSVTDGAFEGKDLNGVDLTALDPAQVKALLKSGNSSRNHDPAAEPRRKTRRSSHSSRPKKQGSQRTRNRSFKKSQKEEGKHDQKKPNKSSKSDLDFKSEHRSAGNKKHNVREHGQDQKRLSSFNGSWCQFADDDGFEFSHLSD